MLWSAQFLRHLHDVLSSIDVLQQHHAHDQVERSDDQEQDHDTEAIGRALQGHVDRHRADSQPQVLRRSSRMPARIDSGEINPRSIVWMTAVIIEPSPSVRRQRLQGDGFRLFKDGWL
jgi:hypothetical protein